MRVRHDSARTTEVVFRYEVDATPRPGFEELDEIEGDDFLILPRLQWLAPFRAASAVWMLSRGQLFQELSYQFENASKPVLVSVVRQRPGCIEEVERGFIVPNDWRERASELRMVKPVG